MLLYETNLYDVLGIILLTSGTEVFGSWWNPGGILVEKHSFVTDADRQVNHENNCSDESTVVTLVSEHSLHHEHGTGQLPHLT